MNRAELVLAVILVFALRSPALGQEGRDQEPDWQSARTSLVERIAEGVKDPRVLNAVSRTERHLFVPEEYRKSSYFDISLPIGDGVTISPPYAVAYMAEQLDPRPTDRVLEIGTGSGYQAAILSPLVAEVYTIEIVERLGKKAAELLKALGYENVHVRVGDGYQGWPAHAPFDKIIVTCSPERIPEPLVAQLKEGGRMLIPLGKRYQQSLCLVTKKNGELEKRVLEATFFVPMTGRAEELRATKDDDGRPMLVNGDFEQMNVDRLPVGWHYFRQAQLVDDAKAPSGHTYLRFSNATPAGYSQAIQAIGLDGNRFREIDVSVFVQSDDVKLGEPGSFSGIDVRFYDANRSPIGTAKFGPWLGGSSWAEHGTRFRVPPDTRLVMIAIGLFGATGEICFDQLRLTPTNAPFKDPLK